MKIGNIPKTKQEAVEGKIYWSLTIGKDAIRHMFLDNGWRGVELIILKPYKNDISEGIKLPTLFRFAFAFWLPIYFI